MILWFIVISVLYDFQRVEGSSDVIYIGMLKEDQTLSRVNRLKNFEIIQNSGIEALGNGGFHISTGGVYHVSTSVITEVKKDDKITLAVNVNEELISDSSLQSMYDDIPGTTTIQVHGLLKCSSGASIVVYLISNSSGHVLKKSSRISLVLLSSVLNHQGFSLRLLHDVPIKKAISRLKWTSLNAFGNFIDTNLFTISEGYLVTESNGLYYVSGNFMMRNRFIEKCTHHVYMYIDKLTNSVVMSTKATFSAHKIFTINFARTFYLQKGRRVWLQILSSCFYTDILKHSTYSLTYLTSKQGYSLQSEKFSSYLHTQGWTLMRLNVFEKNSPGGYISEGHQIQSDHLLIKTDGTILVTGIFYFKAPLNSTDLKVMITRNGRPQFGLKDTPHVQSTSSSLSIYRAMITISSLMVVKANDFLIFSIYFPTSETWILVKNSSISLVYVKSNVEHNVAKVHKFQGESLSWSILKSCKINNDRQVNFKNGVIKVMQSGIYFMSIYVTVLGYKQNQLSLAMIFDKDNSIKKKEALSATETSINQIFTLKLASSLRIDTDQPFGFYLRVPVSFEFQAKCSVSLTYLGYIPNVIGFQGNLQQDLKKSAGYSTADGYYDPSRVKLSRKFYYNTGKNFNFKTGVFTAPMAGIYLVSVNVVIRNANAMADDSFFTVVVYYKNHPNSVLLSKRLEKINHVAADRKATMSFCITAPMKLQSSDELVLKILSRTDYDWTIDKCTSFSVVLLSSLQFANGFVAHRSVSFNINTKDKWAKILGWSTSNPTDGRFDGTSLKSPELVANEQIMIHTTGLYILIFHLHLKQNIKQKHFQIGLFVEDESYHLKLLETCDELADPFKITSTSCFLIMKCEKNHKYMFKLYSSDGIDRSNLYNFHQEKLHVAFLSAVLLNQPLEYEAGGYHIKDDIDLSEGTKRLSPWYRNQLISSPGSNSFDAKDGILTAKTAGWYMVSLQVVYKIPFGNVTIILSSEDKGETEVLQSFAVARSKVSSELSLTGVLFLPRNAKAISSIATFGPGEVISHKTSFTYAHLPNLFDTLNQRFTKISSFGVKSAKNVKITSWKQIGATMATNDDISIAKRGVYIITANFVISSAINEISLDMNVSGRGKLYSSNYSSKTDEVFTLLLSGVVIFKSTSIVSYHINSGGKASVLPKSSVSVAFLGDDISLYPVFVMEVIRSKWYGERTNRWMLITAFEERTKKNFYHRNSVIVTKLSGVFFISANLIFSSRRSSLYLFGVFLNDQLVISASKFASSIFTISIAQTAYLRKGAVLALKVMSNSAHRFQIQSGSTFSTTLVENLDSNDDVLTPSITSGLMHSSVTQLAPDMSATLECNSVGEGEKSYKWFRNNELLRTHTSSVLHMNQAKHGYYQCQALTDNVGPVSKITYVVVKEVNECLDRKKHCAGSNLTCEDTLGSYKCGCMYGLRYINGHCYANDSNVDIVRQSNPNRIPLAILIMVPFLCITFFIIVTLSIYTCIKRQRRNREPDIETIAFSVYNENEQVEEIALQNLSSSVNGSSSNEGVLPSGRDNADRASLGTTLSYAPSNVNDSEDEEDVGGFNEYKWRKLVNANTSV